MLQGKLVIFSAPSGSGKTTIVRQLMERFDCLEFSVSATSRAPRGTEKEGEDYYFFSLEEFDAQIAKDNFIEWEEVYNGLKYGTLRSEIEEKWAKGSIVLFDVDVKGGLKLKSIFGDNALSVFVMPPSISELRRRLEERKTDSKETIEKRLLKAEQELSFAEKFDKIIINDNLETAIKEVEKAVSQFIKC